MHFVGYEAPIIGEQGFVDEKGKFLTRKEAKIEAERCNQLLGGRLTSQSLFSEKLWEKTLTNISQVGFLCFKIML